jgi:hypothetical protein
MKISGAGMGALVGCLGRATVVLINLGHNGAPAVLAMPSAGIGLLVGAIAGAFGQPLLGAIVGAVLSGAVFELFVFACVSTIGTLDARGGANFISQTVVYCLEMAVTSAVAGAVGGLVGRPAADRRD